MTDAPRVLYDVAEAVATLTLNRPDKRNALDDRTVGELHTALARAEADPAVRVVVLRGAGPAFCAGADLDQMARIAAGMSVHENLADAQALGAVFVRIRRGSKPVIAAVHGQALAGGAGLATACDIVLMAEDAEIGYPEVHLGFVPAMVMAILRRAVGEKVAFELATKAERIRAAEAHRLGLVNRVFAADSFDEETERYARELALRPPTAIALTKRLLYGMDGLSFEEAIARGAEVNVLARTTEESREGVKRFLARQKKK